jgi:hypothetical protein
VIDKCLLQKSSESNTRFLLLRFRSALHCGYSGITDIQDGLFFVLTHARTLKKAWVRCAKANSKIFAKTFNIFIQGLYLYQWYHSNHNAKHYENVIRRIYYLPKEFVWVWIKWSKVLDSWHDIVLGNLCRHLKNDFYWLIINVYIW